MKNLLAVAATLVALIALPINSASAYRGGSSGGHSGGHSSGGHSSGGSHAHTNTSHAHTNTSHTNTNHVRTNTNHVHTNTGSHTRIRTGHTYHAYHYSSHVNGSAWNQKDWNHAWRRSWYHTHPRLWNGGWWWWDIDRLGWVGYDPGAYIPEDYYVADDEPPADLPGGGLIRIVNPADSTSTIAYTINSYPYSIEPGNEQDLDAGQQWVIDFDRGGDNGSAEYNLQAGEYDFGSSDHGLELFRASSAAPN
jgi:hypothetical protein